MNRQGLRLCAALLLACACSGRESGQTEEGAPDASLSPGMDASATHDAESFDNPRQSIVDASQDAADAVEVDASWHGEVPEVCDGSQSIRLRLRDVCPGNRAFPGESALTQNGYAYWLITGECHYYALFGPERWLEVRHGQLSPGEAQELGRRLHFGDPVATGHYEAQALDACTTLLELGDATVSTYGCFMNCPAPSAVEDAVAQAFDIGRELAASGELWDGPIRVSCVERGGPPNKGTPFYTSPWPLVTPPELVSVKEENLAGYMGVLIEDRAELDRLRALKTATNAVNSMNMYGFVHIQATDTTYYELRFRDAIPLEDKDGFIPRSWSGPASAEGLDAGM